jgi:hypothetical protein
MYLVGGYVVSWEDTHAWALRRWPDINIYNESLVPNIINRYSREHGGNINCLAIYIKEVSMCIFITHEKLDPTATRYRHKYFRESEQAVKHKEYLFPNEADKDIGKFMTICDPYERGY